MRKLFPQIRITSRRERMTYWLVGIGVFMYLVSIAANVSLIETAAMFGAIAAPCAWYINKETDKASKTPM